MLWNVYKWNLYSCRTCTIAGNDTQAVSYDAGIPQVYGYKDKIAYLGETLELLFSFAKPAHHKDSHLPI